MESIIQQLIGTSVYGSFLFYFTLNIITVTILSYSIYFKRYHNRDAFIGYMLFNIFAFTVITAFLNMSTGLDVGFGFGLFAVLSLIRLRSESLSRTDLTYFFGSLSIALIHSLGIEPYGLVLLIDAIFLIGAWIIDHPRLLSNVQNMKLTLDHIPKGIMDGEGTARNIVSKEFGLDVISCKVKKIDHVKDTVALSIAYKEKQ